MEPSQQKICTTEIPKYGSSLSDTSKIYLEAESYLQSLGFINNGKARFILDEHNSPVMSNIAPTEFTIVNEDDSMSFVILGKSSLDMIQASSLASYADIQQKSMSIDYSSIISSLNSTEIHQKLLELLQENSKLKETLKQNNTSMKQQFNTLATWQEEIMKIHQNHKKKFAETRELINYLNKENAELKMKLSMDRKENTDIEYKIIDKRDLEDKSEEEAGSSKVIELQDKISSLTEELNNSKSECAKLSSDIQKLISISDLTSSQLKQATSTIQEQRVNIKRLESMVSQSQLEKSNNTLCDKCFAKDKDIDSLKESLTLLEHKLEHVTTPVQFCIKNPLNPRQYRQQYIHSIKQCNERLQELTTCIEKQVNRYATIEKWLNDLIETLGVTEPLTKSRITSEAFDYSLLSDQSDIDVYKEKILNYYKRLVDERSKLEEDRQHAIKVQSQFQKLLLDYNSILYELETMSREKKNANPINNAVTCEAAQNTGDIDELKTESMKSLDEERKLLTQERERLEEEKKMINTRQAKLDVEYKNLKEAKELLQQEKISLHEEKTSLDQQSQLYEDHEKALQVEKKMLEAKYDRLVSETNALTEDVQRKAFRITQLQRAIEQHTEDTNLLQTQLKYYEEDFGQEKKVKELLIKEKRKLETDLQNQIEFNKQLQKEITRLKNMLTGGNLYAQNGETSTEQQGDTALTPPVVSSYVCPKCDCKFRTVESLEYHVQRCIDFD